MAGFKVHMVGGINAAAISTACAFSTGMASLWALICIFSFGVVGGILPDLDSDTGRPIRLLFILVSSLLVLVTISSLLSNGSTFATIIISVGLVYCASLTVFFVGKKFTVHRGVMHSIPFAFFVGVVAAIVSSSLLGEASLWVGMTAFAGVLVHLVLDELNSLGVHYSCIPYIKKSFGTALKFTGKSLTTTCILYGTTIILAFVYVFIV